MVVTQFEVQTWQLSGEISEYLGLNYGGGLSE
jgi:hypothetical protein